MGCGPSAADASAGGTWARVGAGPRVAGGGAGEAMTEEAAALVLVGLVTAAHAGLHVCPSRHV